MFLYPVAVLAPIGLYYLRHHRIVQLLIVIGLLAAPIPAVIKGSPYAIQRASGLLIYVSLLSGAGLMALAMSNRLLAAGERRAACDRNDMAIQRVLSRVSRQLSCRLGVGLRSDSISRCGGVVIESDRRRAAAVYMPSNFYDAGAKWRFYTRKHDRPALWRNTRYFGDVSALGAAPAGSIAVVPQVDASATPPDGWERSAWSPI